MTGSVTPAQSATAPAQAPAAFTTAATPMDSRDVTTAETVPSARRESLHRVRCCALTVADLRIGPDQPRDVPGPSDRGIVDSVRAFASHPYGPEVFPTVCNAVGLVLSRRAEAP